jgi:hypothetical protein
MPARGRLRERGTARPRPTVTQIGAIERFLFRVAVFWTSMRSRRAIRAGRNLAAATAATGLAVGLVGSSPAVASSTQESIIQDDSHLIYATPGQMAHNLQQMASLGVDRVKVSLVWSLVAPSPYSSVRPRFDATDPAAYPPGAWDRYDMLVRMARELGLRIYFEISPPDPVWAIARGERTSEGPALGHAPDANLFRQFVQAAGKRYGGRYLAPTPARQPPPSALGRTASNAVQPTAIPRVSYWGIWNEPNDRSWLNPLYQRIRGGLRAMIQPELYRELVGAAWSGLGATGHTPARDTILVGELANQGVWEPVPFVQALYCVSSSYRPLRGLAAAENGCPPSGNRARFVAQNPGLFSSTGFAHHPYAFDVPPDRPYPDRTFVTLYNIASLESVLDRTFAAYGKHPPGGVPLYLTEWGYQTNPPNRYVKTSPARQALWLNEGEYMAWKLPYVKALAQFELVDEPIPHTQMGSRAHWSSFQTGLEYAAGTAKPAFAAYQLPIWVPNAVYGPNVTVWGQLRPVLQASLQSAELEFRPAGVSTWTQIHQIQTTNPEGFFNVRVALPSPGAVRLTWTDPPAGPVYHSRVAQIG